MVLDERAAFGELRSQMAYIAAYDLDELDGMKKDRLVGRLRAIIDRARRAVHNARAASPQSVEQTAQVPQFDAKHVSLKERADGKLVLTLLLDGVESAPRYKVTPVNPGVVRVAQPVEQTRALTDEQIKDIAKEHFFNGMPILTCAVEFARTLLTAALPASGEPRSQ